MAPPFRFGQAMLFFMFLNAMEAFGRVEKEVLPCDLMLESKEFFDLPDFMPRLLDELFAIDNMNLIAWKMFKPKRHPFDIETSDESVVIHIDAPVGVKGQGSKGFENQSFLQMIV